jgi:hypothetical protein
MLKEGMSLLSREFAFTSSTLSTIQQVKTIEETDVPNRLIFEAIRTVVLDCATPSWIQDVDLETQAEPEDAILPTGMNLVRCSRYSNTRPNKRGSLPGTYRLRDHQLLQIKLWPADEAMLNILHKASTGVRELHMHWIYDVGTIVPGDQPVVRSKTLDKWVGKLERVKVTVRSEPSKTFAGRMATDLVERTAKRLVSEKGKGETSMRWKEKDIEDDEGFKKDEYKMQTRYVVVESRTG